jgi:predicted Zn finger-like uncharacterized protein
VKFLCDRCNTRYSIGDDRVRGKILKIRCKTCANVITVREGMPNQDASEPAGPQGPRRVHTTTAAPAIQSESSAPVPAPAAPSPAGALGAAFASAMTKPPPALEEEWYVSIDGDQAGPFSLADAQRWVAGKPLDAELFCWSEGFDDWLPVDKVSHFRGLRKRAATSPPVAVAPPPMPRAPGGALRGGTPGGEPAAEEPRPLFAATMAQLEKGAATPSLRGLSNRPSATPPNGQTPMAMRAHGNGAQGAAVGARAGLPSPLSAFDASELAGGPAMDPSALDPAAEAAEAAATAPRMPAVGDDGDDDDDLDIGEVSRVVKLADLAREAGRPKAAGTPPPKAAAARATAFPRPGTARPGELPPGPFANEAAEEASLLPAAQMAPPPPAVSHRRGMIALIAGALALVGVAVGVVFFVLSGDEGGGGRRLGTVEKIDTTRPEEVRLTVGGGEVVVAPPEAPPSPLVPRPKRPAITAPVPPPGGPELPPAGGARLEAREIEEMAGKNSSVTQRCYMRAQRGADGILLGDVKKISVTLTISGEGLVTETLLSDNHAQNTLGKCLIGAIKTWKFRPSPGGTFRFVLHFG